MSVVLTGRETLIRHMSYKPVSVDQIKEYVMTDDRLLTSGNFTTPLPVSFNLGGHRAVALVEGSLVYADAANEAHVNWVVGMSVGALSAGTLAQPQFRGLVVEPSWNWDLSKVIYVGNNGLLTQTVPANGFMQQFATPLTHTSVIIDIKEAILL